MATIAEPVVETEPRHDHLSGTPRAHSIDRWIYVFTAASFIVIVLAGFIPSSLGKIAAVQSGARPPFPLILHMHALLMGSFLLLLLAQTTLVATGRQALHMRLGLASMVIAPAIVVVGLLLARGNYLGVWGAAQAAPPEARAELMGVIGILDNILLLQLRIGILFPIFIWIGLQGAARRARPAQEDDDPGDRGRAAGGDRPHPLAADDDAAEPARPGLLDPGRDQPDAALGPDPQPLFAPGLLDLARGVSALRGRGAQPVGHRMVARHGAANHGSRLSAVASARKAPRHH